MTVEHLYKFPVSSRNCALGSITGVSEFQDWAPKGMANRGTARRVIALVCDVQYTSQLEPRWIDSDVHGRSVCDANRSCSAPTLARNQK